MGRQIVTAWPVTSRDARQCEQRTVLAAIKTAARRLRRGPSARLDGCCARSATVVRPGLRWFGRDGETAAVSRTEKLTDPARRPCEQAVDQKERRGLRCR